MTTSHKPEQADGGACTRDDQCLTGTISTVEHGLCGVAGFLWTGAILALCYPALVTVTQPLYVLSSTALVAIATTTWLLTWLGVELVWAWRTESVRAAP